MQFVCDNKEKMEKAVDLFLNQTKRPRRFGNFRITANRITYTYNNHYVSDIAVRIKREGQSDMILGNSSVLEDVGAYSSYGYRHRNRGQTVIQSILQRKIPMLPFVVFKETGLDVDQIEIVEQSPAETVKRKGTRTNKKTNLEETFLEDVHFTGASLFKLGEFFYLFDLDRNELKHHIFNPFVAQIPKPVKTISGAYQALKPAIVLKAEKNKTPVLRQGEWFFIKSKKQLVKTSPAIRAASIARRQIWNDDEIRESDEAMILALKGPKFLKLVRKAVKAKDLPIRFELKAGPNRPNHADRGVKIGKDAYVSGMVTHSGREHEPLDLGSAWWMAIPNTATKSFTITGDVD